MTSARPLAWAAAATLGATAGISGAHDRVLFEDEHVRFIEVTYWPGQPERVAADPYGSVIAADAPWPTLAQQSAVPQAALGTRAIPPNGIVYPWCQTRAALGERTVEVTGDFPQHFYRFDFKRIDGPDFTTHWRSWYPWILAPVKAPADLGRTPQSGAPFSGEFPFPLVYDAAHAAPENHFVRYEDAHVQLVEVTVRPGETENMHGHPYRSVYINDGAGPTDPVPVHQRNVTLVPGKGPSWGGPPGRGSAPPGAQFPDCLAALPEYPHQVTNPDTVPEHFMRLHYKRIDGDDIRTQWRRWYPPAP